jgi:hypothetical protein
MHNCSTRRRPHLSIMRPLMKLPTGVAAECTLAVDCSSHYKTGCEDIAPCSPL